MDDLSDDFMKFHDEIICENAQLKAKIEALENLIKSSIFLLFDSPNYNQLMKEYVINQASNFEDLSRRKQVYNSRFSTDIRRDYQFELNQLLEELK
ncbi:hypothetical protein [Chryseobacterium indologenes]|uniref:hypothetical protein n=1 Tax=Chryseobacterium indologenes TaxID=253 RepID=UPI000BFCDF59|nr:hypothetical protein [Chryseobacterium indologenes]ATN04052.1 hypothetical protein CRN76_00735 [Chryseobacterium indologenes]AYY83284.1 hypothetical protein EGX91_01165 [Chryseobacterium indologenes]MBF6645133.1 hypothetical protein [Chryseobacterium indologenes]QIX80191.1 hypothetical protein FOB56_02530 [Chryseobacterium indologenes]QQQ71189.1 hypothetical protein JHW31_00190 [Chryseobacterium indologenes]